MDTLLFDCLERLKDVAVDALDTPPALQFVTTDDPMSAYGFCPLVAASMAPPGMYRSINTRARGNSLPGRPTMKTAIPQATFYVTVISTDCYPTQADMGEIPPAADIEAAALAVLTDRRDVWSALYAETQAGTLFTGLLAGNDCADLSLPTTAFGPQGQCAGSVFAVYADLIATAAAS